MDVTNAEQVRIITSVVVHFRRVNLHIVDCHELGPYC